jgi:hypothetical protein
MAEEPPLGIHRNAFGIHSFGKLEYKIRDGKVVYRDGGPTGVMVTEQHVGPTTNPPCATSARRSSPYAGAITGSTVPPGSPDSPI